MTRYAFIHEARCVLVAGAFRSPHDGQQYGSDWIEKSTPEDRAAILLLEVVDAAPVPAGRRIVSTEIRPINGVPTEVHTLEDIPLDDRKAALLLAVDAERDRRQQLDLVYDFGQIEAIDDAGNTIAAGERALQMRFEPDQRNWMALQSTALAAVVAGGASTVMPMRAEDNWNVQTTALDVLSATAAMVARNGALIFYGGALKSQIRAAANSQALDAISIEVGWP